ncbi:MAG: tRNA1(Val) (adenine(37)-N6)-methyltransferase [Bacteroidaceae bacterium]|nr:tRNA1(Val) (adenine(37)-N6)-methyltransferase [Bacteroidaceae bacterium]
MSDDSFSFKQFTILQDLCAMKVGTDGVLLGAWAPIEGCSRILDIGTGTGLLALMAAQRCPEARITGIDIDSRAAQQARSNADDSPWSSRIEILAADARDYSPAESFDAILCNPPFFTRSLKNPDGARALARHDDSLSLDDLSRAASRLLTSEGILAVVLPSERKADMIAVAATNNLFLFHQTDVRPTERRNPARVLLAFRKGSPSSRLSDELCITFEGAYTEEYKALTQDFYLKF